jgi:hypothetical protein
MIPSSALLILTALPVAFNQVKGKFEKQKEQKKIRAESEVVWRTQWLGKIALRFGCCRLLWLVYVLDVDSGRLRREVKV